MARRAFYSFHYKPDNWRASQVRNMGVIAGNRPASDNDWETIKKGGDAAIQKWIDGQLSGKSVAIVLIGEKTAGRKWIKYEIKKAWEDGKGVLGIYIHNLKDKDGKKSNKGDNPFAIYMDVKKKSWWNEKERKLLSTIVKAYDPPYSSSKNVYDYIKKHLTNWIKEAIEIREKYD